MIDALLLSLALLAQDGATTAAAAAPQPVDAAESTADTTVFDTDAALAQVNASLNAIESLRADFVQIAPDGSASRGVLSLRRPGRLRFEYAAPSPLLVVAGGGTVAIQDSELGTTDRAPLQATPLWWLLKDDVDLAADADIVDLTREDGFVYITLVDRDGDMEGEVTFLFDAESYALSQWFAEDSLGLVTRVILENVETGIELGPRLFVLDDAPDDRRDRRR
tara:strand:- start:505 stop:1170 length:666 start_codon:yes stop_codon:yes gene_type:complete